MKLFVLAATAILSCAAATLDVDKGKILGSADAPIRIDIYSDFACPACKTPVKLEGEELTCAACGRRYPIRNDIPVMLIEEGDKGRETHEKSRGAGSAS